MKFGSYKINRLRFQDGPIDDVLVADLIKHQDERGWLMEMYRSDEMAGVCLPTMAYVSETLPGVIRGPHLHFEQTDHFVVVGEQTFEFCVWDDRPDHATFGNRMIIKAGGETPRRITIPHRLVHAYRNVSERPARLLNFPSSLYAGENRKSPVDEIRFEEILEHPFHW